MPGPETELTPAIAASKALLKVLATTLCVEELAVAECHVSLGRQIERFGNRNVSDVQVLGLDSCHW